MAKTPALSDTKIAKLEKIVSEFNEKYKPGEEVTLSLSGGIIKSAKITRPAFLLSGQLPAGWFDGECLNLSCVIRN